MSIRIKDSQNVEPREFHLFPIGNTESGLPENISLEQIKDFTDEDKAPVAFTGDYSDLINTPNLDNYATLNTLNTSYYNRNQINELVSSIDGVQFEKVDELPEVGKSNTIYLLLQEGDATNNIFDEYIFLKDGNTFEKIGSTEADFENYYDKVQIDNMIPTVYNSTITIRQSGVTRGSFSLNQPNNATIDLNSSVVAQIQPDWNQADSSEADYIKNKPETKSFTITYEDDTQETIKFYIK